LQSSNQTRNWNEPDPATKQNKGWSHPQNESWSQPNPHNPKPNTRECKSTLVEGGGIGVAIETAASHIKVEPAAGGGSLVKVDSTYKLLPGVEVKDEIAKAKESVTAIFKAAEAFLVANPDAYN